VPADRIPLAGPPLLADKDFLSYNLTNHTFTVSAATAKRLAVSLDPENPYKMASGEFVFWIGSPPRSFVLCAFGKPIYEGHFTSGYSSMVYRGPTIWCTHSFLTSNDVANVSFAIHPSSWPPGANDPDRRADKEIIRALKKLKLAK